jgi:hypothetical protein
MALIVYSSCEVVLGLLSLSSFFSLGFAPTGRYTFDIDDYAEFWNAIPQIFLQPQRIIQTVMMQCRAALRPDGLFLAAMLGGTTLQELRIACTLAQQEREGGVAPRTSPLAQVSSTQACSWSLMLFSRGNNPTKRRHVQPKHVLCECIPTSCVFERTPLYFLGSLTHLSLCYFLFAAQVRDAGNLLTRAGLAIPTVDVDDIIVGYPDPIALVRHLRRMGESNALLQRREALPRDTALAAAAAYVALFGSSEAASADEAAEKAKSEMHEDGDDDLQAITATYQVVYMTGWAPDPSQKKAAKRGTATVSLQDLSRDLGSS